MSCPLRKMMREDLVNAKVIDKYDNIMPNEYALFSKIKTRWTETLRKEYNSVGDPFYAQEGGRKVIFNDELLYKIDASREIFYRENEHLKPFSQGFTSMLSKTLTSFNRIPNDEFRQRGQMAYYKGSIYVLEKEDILNNEFVLYNEKGITKVSMNDEKEIQFLQNRATHVKIDGRSAIVLPNEDSIQTNPDGTRRYVSKGNKFDRNKAIEAKQLLRDFKVGIDDVMLQLHENSKGGLSYDEFRKEVYNMVNLYKDSYGALFIQEKIKCL